MTSPIVSSEWLADHPEDPSIKIFEISSEIEDDRYRAGHIPGAVHRFWKDLCWHETNREFVTPETLALRLGNAGVGTDDTLVLYGDPVQYGTYVFWSLTMGGHKDLRLLDGALTKWNAEGRPLSSAVPSPSAIEHAVIEGDASMRVGRDNVREHLGRPGRFLLDVRSPEEYSGERVMEYGKFDHGAERGGRIPGAKHLYFKELLNEDDSFKSAEDLQLILDRVGADPDKVEEIVCYCRLSHRASLAWMAMTHILGYQGVKIYDGSWTEWGSIVGFPVEK